MAILVEMELRDMPEGEAVGKLVSEIMAGVIEGGHGFSLLLLAPASGDPDGRMPPIGAYVSVHNLDGHEARIFGFEADDLGKLLPERLGHP